MEIFLGTIIGSIFIYINFLIAKKDTREKIIPNIFLIYLLILLPFWYMYAGFFEYFSNINILKVILQSIFVLLVSFSLFHFGIWGAGDAKYLLVILLYIPHIPILLFLGNISFIILLYIFISYLIFWFTHTFQSQKRKVLYDSIKKHVYDIFHQKYKNISSIITQCIHFLLLFLCIRLMRTYFLDISEIQDLTKKYHIYILLFLFVITLVLGYIVKKICAYFNISKVILILFLICIIIGEYIINPYFFQENILIIMTIYLGFYIVTKIFWAGQKIVFSHYESEIIEIKDLKVGMKINKKILPLTDELKKEISSLMKEEDIDILKIYGVKNVQIMKNFSFGPYMFMGLLSTLLYTYFGEKLGSIFYKLFL